MSLTAFLLIAVSAASHAAWNLISKKSKMTVSFYAIVCTICTLCWCNVQFWTPLKVLSFPPEFFLTLAGVIFFDVVYSIGLTIAYQKMDMSAVYPILRALPLLFTALVTSLLGWGAKLPATAVIGMFIVFAGCICMPLAKFSDFKLSNYRSKGMLFTIFAALGTTGYTILDSQAQKILLPLAEEANVSKVVLALTYYSTRAIGLTSTLTIICLSFQAERKNYIKFWKELSAPPLFAGMFASLTYVSVLIAMNYVSNVSYVQVFRQMGLIFALLGGIFILKEKACLPKFTGVILIISGLILTVI